MPMKYHRIFYKGHIQLRRLYLKYENGCLSVEQGMETDCKGKRVKKIKKRKASNRLKIKYNINGEFPLGGKRK